MSKVFEKMPENLLLRQKMEFFIILPQLEKSQNFQKPMVFMRLKLLLLTIILQPKLVWWAIKTAQWMLFPQKELLMW